MIHFAESTSDQIMGYLKVHQVYQGVERSGEILWSFHPIFGGKRYEILGPAVSFAERKAGSEKSRTCFQIPGQKRWHPAAMMAEFAFNRESGFRWADLDLEPRCMLEFLALGYVGFGDDRLKDRPYYEVKKGLSVPKDQFEDALTLCEGYGFAQSGFAYEPIKVKK